MNPIVQNKVKKFKRELIREYESFLKYGLMTVKEIEWVVSTEVYEAHKKGLFK